MVLAGALVAPLSAHAALNFDFSFTGPLDQGGGTGTVTGEIFGLTDNATSAPTDVVIDSYPAAIGGLPPAPWDLYAIPGFIFGENGTPLLANHFTVTNGVITDALFGLFAPPDTPVLDLGYGGVDAFLGPHNAVVIGPSTAIFTLDRSDAVPEPEAWALMICGLFGVGAVLRRRAAGAAFA